MALFQRKIGMAAAWRGHLAFGLARLARFGLRLLGRGATAFPGDLALKFDPQLLSKLCAGRELILVSGTNGKTSTCRMLQSILESEGRTVLNNQSGANLAGGLVTAMVAEHAKLRSERLTLLFEMDEAYFARYAPQLGARAVLITNFFRDQLDRYGELTETRDLIARGLSQLEADGGILVTCGDDPLALSLAEAHPGASFIFRAAATEGGEPALKAQQMESTHCPLCSAPLDYEALVYGHLGRFQCSACAFGARPADLTFSVQALGARKSQALFCEVATDVTTEVEIGIPAYHNVYNAAGAFLLARRLGIGADVAALGLARAHASFGRMERLTLEDGRELCLILAKNPIGLNQALDYALDQDDRGGLFLLLNDGENDGRDVSWIWDCDYEGLLDERRPEQIFVAGRRALDLALRLRYVGYDDDQLIVREGLAATLEAALAACPVGRCLYVIPNYTSLLALYEVLRKDYKMQAFWENQA